MSRKALAVVVCVVALFIATLAVHTILDRRRQAEELEQQRKVQVEKERQRQAQVATERQLEQDEAARKMRDGKRLQSLDFQFLGLKTGMSRAEIAAHLRDLRYSPMACDDGTTRSNGIRDVFCNSSKDESAGPYKLQLHFIHNQLTSLICQFPTELHGQMLSSLREQFGEPTIQETYFPKSNVMWQSSADCSSTVPCRGISLKLTSQPFAGESPSTVFLFDGPLLHRLESIHP
jgi:hypothetical protein